jgi:tripartite-type tricarboxylate transporter receptor subunit TctC
MANRGAARPAPPDNYKRRQFVKRSTFLKAVTSIALAAALPISHAAEWPQRSVTLVLPFSPGGSTDYTGRLLAEKLSKVLGQPVVVENKPGAGGNIGAAYVARATDGHTLLMHTSTAATNVSLYKKPGFDLQKDLIPVSQVALIPNVLMVNNDIPARNLQEFVELVKQKKVVINYGSAGNGTSQHLSAALFNSMVNGEMVHVPYKGGAPANTDLISGQIQAVFSPLVEVLGYIDSGRLRPLAVTTKARSARLPNVPSVSEVLPNYDVVLWNGVFAPAGTPEPVITRLNAAIRQVLADPAMRKTLADQGSTPVGNSPAEFKQVLAGEIDKWGKLVKLSGATVD